MDTVNDKIVLSHVYKSYHGQPVLTDLCLEIPYGRVTALTAPSGAGKTTLLRLILGLEAPDSGTITGASGLKKSVVFQEDRLCENLTALANLQLTAADKSNAAIIAAMEGVGLADCSAKPARELSGGMKRRIAILRALLADYDLLILDEPFRGLDADTRELVIADTYKRCAGKTVIFTTHDPTELEKMHVFQEAAI